MRGFTTLSGSVYEVDEPNKRIRRTYGTAPPTERQGEDGEWREYLSLDRVGDDEPHMLIVWRNVDGVLQSTVTSQIVEVFTEEQMHG